MKQRRRRGGPPPAQKPSKSEKIARNLAKTLRQYLQGRRYKPSSLNELIAQLAIPEVHHDLFEKVLGEMVSTNELALEKHKYAVPSTAQRVIGSISVHKKGFGFLRQTEGSDVFVPKQYMMDAVDGDEVEVEVNPVVSAKGPEGRVIAILKRSRTHLAGIIVSKTGRHYTAYAPLLGPDKPVIVKPKGHPLKEGDRIICKVIEWSNSEEMVEAEADRVIGHISDPSIDIKAAIEEFEIPDGFTEEALEEARSYGSKISPKEAKNRLDITDWECVTIDPDTAKDFDDAITLTCDEKGHYHLGVHIADVAHYVKSGSHLDQEALTRCNSTYFPGQCVPMLPEELSNELCSLKPNVKRLTQSIFAEFNPNGDLVHYKVARSCIKSQKRFTYKEALQVIEKKKKSPHLPLLERMVALCALLKKKRNERGSIDFAMADDVILVDDKGVPLKIERVEYDITHQMIEEFMLKANEIAARHLADQGKTLIYRVHEQPNAESFQEFYAFARSLGFQMPATPTHRDIQKLFHDAKEHPDLHAQLSVHFIRSMRLACYSSENLGHYGLALEHYCHFTSPIRRYTDLIIQRLLFDELPDATDLEDVAAACSEKERISFRAESSVVILKKLRLAEQSFRDDPEREYKALVTKIRPFALQFEVPLFDLEGTLHVSQIGNDYYEYNAARMQLRGSRSGKTYQAGQEILVRLSRINLILQQAEWAIVSPKKEK